VQQKYVGAIFQCSVNDARKTASINARKKKGNSLVLELQTQACKDSFQDGTVLHDYQRLLPQPGEDMRATLH
jgi:hypothetical protein